MKKKIYTKQMKSSQARETKKESSKRDSTRENKNESKDASASKTSSRKRADPSASTSLTNSGQLLKDKTQPAITTSPSTVLLINSNNNSSASSTIVPDATLRQSVSNSASPGAKTTPLPTVDVLMKSSLRAFQITENHRNNNNNNNNGYVTDKPLPSVIAAPSYMASEHIVSHDQQSTTNEPEVWRIKATNVDPTLNPETNSQTEPIPLSMTNAHYGRNDTMEYVQPAGYEVRDSTGDMTKTDSHGDSSPVYHQMETPLQPLPLPDHSVMYQTHSSTLTPNYVDLNDHGNGIQGAMISVNGQVIHETSPNVVRLHEMAPYQESSFEQQRHREGETPQVYGGQIRAWEQENSRYVNYPTWQTRDEHIPSSDSVYMQTSSEEDDDDDSVVDVAINTAGLQRSKRSYSERRHGSGGKSGGGGGSSRRRRKRVQTPVQRSAANMRERRRMCHLNVAFDHLKDHLPHVKDKKKLSRIQTLKAAIYYIHLLQDSLNTAPRGAKF